MRHFDPCNIKPLKDQMAMCCAHIRGRGFTLGTSADPLGVPPWGSERTGQLRGTQFAPPPQREPAQRTSVPMRSSRPPAPHDVMVLSCPHTRQPHATLLQRPSESQWANRRLPTHYSARQPAAHKIQRLPTSLSATSCRSPGVALSRMSDIYALEDLLAPQQKGRR